jgi:anhydro-N-acetylmuramic acid kinase
VQFISSHGHTTFHEPANKMTGQIGCGAAIAATTGINVVSDLRAMDVALGGQGAPIVPIGEKLLLGDSQFFLNLGGIANISANLPNNNYIAFDVCPANRVLNMLVQQMGHAYDKDGAIAATGTVNNELLAQLNNLDYYQLNYPKSLANDFGTDVLYPIINNAGLSVPDALSTMVQHLAIQLKNSVALIAKNSGISLAGTSMLACGGGALNGYEVQQITAALASIGVTLIVPNKTLIEFKEALVMALIGALRWREENNVLHTVTGASRSSIGGAVWIGQDA